MSNCLCKRLEYHIDRVVDLLGHATIFFNCMNTTFHTQTDGFCVHSVTITIIWIL